MEKLLDKAVLYIISGQTDLDDNYDLRNMLLERLHNKADSQRKVNLVIEKVTNCLAVKYYAPLADSLRRIISIYDVENLNYRISEARQMIKRQIWYETFMRDRSTTNVINSEFYFESGKIQSNSAQQRSVNHPDLNTGKIQSNYEILNKPYHPETAAFAEGVVRGLGLKPCRDRTIIAVIEDSGKFFVGTNGMMYDVGMCQRNEANHKINQGYHLCKNVCVQPEHAEVAAINKWKVEAVNKNPILHVFGAKRVCDDCRRYAKQNGIRRIAVYKDMAHLKTLLSKEY